MRISSRAVALLVVAFMALSACKKDKPAIEQAAPGVKATAEAPAKVEKKAPAAAMKKAAAVPADVWAYGGAKGFDALINTMNDVLKAFPQVPNPSAMIFQGMQASMNLKNLDWLDKGKPVYFAALNEQKFKDGGIVLLPVTKAEALAAALPDTKQGDAGKGFTYEYLGQTFFVKMVGSHAGITNDAKAFEAAEAFMTGTLQKLTLTDLVEVYVPVKNILAVHGKELDGALAQLDKMAADPAMGPMLDKGSLESLKAMGQGAVDFAKAVEEVRFAVKFEGDVVSIPISGIVKQGSKAVDLLNGLASRPVQIYKNLPGDSYFTFALNIDPKMFLAYKDFALKTYQELFKFGEAELKAIDKFMVESYGNSTGDMAMSVAPYGGFPVNVFTFAGVKDMKKAEASMTEFWKLFEPKLVAFMKQELGKEGLPPIQGETLQAVLDAFKPMMEPMGVKLEIVSKDVKGHMVFGLNIAVDYANPALAANPEMAMVKQFVGEKFGMMYAGRGDGVYLFVMSAKADELVQKFLDKKLGGTPKLSDKAARVLSSSSVFMAADVAGALKQFSAMPMVAMFKAKIDALKTSDLYSYFRASGNTFEAGLTLPIKLIADVTGIFGGMGM